MGETIATTPEANDTTETCVKAVTTGAKEASINEGECDTTNTQLSNALLPNENENEAADNSAINESGTSDEVANTAGKPKRGMGEKEAPTPEHVETTETCLNAAMSGGKEASKNEGECDTTSTQFCNALVPNKNMNEAADNTGIKVSGTSDEVANTAGMPGRGMGEKEAPTPAVSYTHLTLPTICSV